MKFGGILGSLDIPVSKKFQTERSHGRRHLDLTPRGYRGKVVRRTFTDRDGILVEEIRPKP